ncbi:MAG: saccharopine dehydrogenase family protein, partial [Bacteroidota bacterium]
PAMTGAYMMLTGQWSGKGVFNVEELNPDPFLEKLAASGLPWHEKENIDLELD